MKDWFQIIYTVMMGVIVVTALVITLRERSKNQEKTLDSQEKEQKNMASKVDKVVDDLRGVVAQLGIMHAEQAVINSRTVEALKLILDKLEKLEDRQRVTEKDVAVLQQKSRDDN